MKKIPHDVIQKGEKQLYEIFEHLKFVFKAKKLI